MASISFHPTGARLRVSRRGADPADRQDRPRATADPRRASFATSLTDRTPCPLGGLVTPVINSVTRCGAIMAATCGKSADLRLFIAWRNFTNTIRT
ncbi:hypothetical protein CcI156_08475 [Frankia sp. CcI156]|nr:hypothetical protein Manayef4_01750 [Frankia sp. CgIM4]ONH27231.1 hypothetical protein CcI156_08475 [Frankia sp. CcI156]ORT51964.1 hypothetical protein KBI5_10465 [Frankia sp. KB5]